VQIALQRKKKMILIDLAVAAIFQVWILVSPGPAFPSLGEAAAGAQPGCAAAAFLDGSCVIGTGESASRHRGSATGVPEKA
jgi:hypothetical protein